MAAAETAWRDSLRSVSIADLAGAVGSDSGPGALAAYGSWLAAGDA
jgi:hypothetical protein